MRVMWLSGPSRAGTGKCVIAMLALLLAGNSVCSAANDDLSGWVGNFTITPGIGIRMLELAVNRASDGYKGNVVTSGKDMAYAALNIESPSYPFGNSNMGFTFYTYVANVSMNEQWTAEGGKTTASGATTGSYMDVGTSVSGYYSYFVPALYHRFATSIADVQIALGYGKWLGKFSGDIILTPDNQPRPGLPMTTIDVDVSRNAYLVLMQAKFDNNVQIYMSIGGPRWNQNGLNLELSELSLVVGYTFNLF